MKKFTLLLLLFLSSTLSFSQIVTNGNFQTGTASPWFGNAANVVELSTGQFVNQANVTGVGQPFTVNLSQVVSLTNGLTYQLSFDAFTDVATGSRTMVAGLGQNGAPWAALTATPTLTSTPQTFTYQFTINYGEAVDDRVIFDMGAALGFVFIDNVSVVQVVNTCNNGVLDGTETGIDCGGSCPPCVPTPSVAATTPPARPADDVISVYSDAYSNITVSEWGPNWGPSSARINDFPIQSNPTKVIDLTSGQVFGGIDFAASKFDATTFTTFHLDYWVAAPLPVGQVISIKLSNHDETLGAGETSAIQFVPSALLTNQWVPLDIPFSSFIAASAPSNFSRNDIAQIVVTAARADNSNPIRIYIDNIYFHKNTILSTPSFEASSVKMYPNPTNNVVNFDCNESIDSISIVNVLGQTVLTKNVNAKAFTIDISALNAGQYFINMVSGNGKAVNKIIKY